MKKVTILLVLAFLTLMVSSVTYAREPQAPEGVNTFLVSPDPAAAGSIVTISINANMTAGSDNQTRFCLYAPTTAVGTFPATITLAYSSGFSTTSVNFTGSGGGGTCPARTGQTARLYTSPTTLPITDTTYEGSATFDIANGAVAGIYDWTLLLEEPGSGVNPLSVQHEITAAETPYTGLSGRIIDSKNLAPWMYGAEIKVYQSTGTNVGLKGTTYANESDGTWAVTFGTTDDLSLCPTGGCSLGNNGATYIVTVNFKCNLETTNGTRTSITDNTQFTNNGHCPINGMTAVPVQFEVSITDNATGANFDVGDWETGRGPTAVTLQSVTTDSNPTAIGIGFVVLMLAGVTFVMFRRREVA